MGGDNHTERPAWRHTEGGLVKVPSVGDGKPYMYTQTTHMTYWNHITKKNYME